MLDLFKSKQQKAAEREQKLREGKIRIRQHIASVKRINQRVLELAKRALTLKDDVQFRQLGRRYLVLQDDINKKERYVLSLEALEAQLDQSRASVSFMEALKSLTTSVMAMGDPQNIAAMQRDAESGLARAQSLSDRMDVLMDLATDAIDGAGELDDGRLRELEASLKQETTIDKPNPADDRIEAALKKIADDMRRAS